MPKCKHCNSITLTEEKYCKRCCTEGCTNSAVSGYDNCVTHGGGIPYVLLLLWFQLIIGLFASLPIFFPKFFNFSSFNKSYQVLTSIAKPLIKTGYDHIVNIVLTNLKYRNKYLYL